MTPPATTPQETGDRKKWFASDYINSIKRKKYDEKQDGVHGVYFDTWEEAKAHLVKLRMGEVALAENALARVRSTLKKAQSMTPPSP